MGKGRASSEIQWSLLQCEASFRDQLHRFETFRKVFIPKISSTVWFKKTKYLVASPTTKLHLREYRAHGCSLDIIHCWDKNIHWFLHFQIVWWCIACLFVRYFVWNQVHKITIIFGLFQIKLHSENLRPWLI